MYKQKFEFQNCFYVRDFFDTFVLLQSLNMSKKLVWLLVISAIVRCFLATFLELGNDEVYYRIFGLFPDWSYFDHSPMVGWLIRLTTLGATNVAEFFVRLSAVAIGTLNTYIIYRIAKKLGGSEKTGLFAALLYTGSIYCSIILGTFIMPDTPLSLFWLLALSCLIEILPSDNFNHKKMLLSGVFIGLAMLSKYTGAYLWGATLLYILLFNRKWLKQWSLYVSGVISVILFLPVILWNIEYDFISFTFHSGRVTAENSINWLYFGREVMGSVFYNNPINFVVIIIAIMGFKECLKKLANRKFYFLLTFSLPMILLFLSISLTRETLPHWAAPAYFSLIILASVFLTRKSWGGRVAMSSPIFLLGVVLIGFAQIRTGFLPMTSDSEGRMGNADFTLDMYGWRQGGEKFAQLRKVDTFMPTDASLINFTWDGAAHIDTYFAQPLGLKTLTIGDLQSTHYWEWINRKRGGFSVGDSVYLVVSSRLPIDPNVVYGDQFEKIMPADTIKIERYGRHVMNFYIYRLLGLKSTSPALQPLRDVLEQK